MNILTEVKKALVPVIMALRIAHDYEICCLIETKDSICYLVDNGDAWDTSLIRITIESSDCGKQLFSVCEDIYQRTDPEPVCLNKVPQKFLEVAESLL